MRIFGALTIIFYTLVCLVFGFALVVLAFNTIPLETAKESLYMIYTLPNVRFGMGAAGIGIMLIGLLIARFASGRLRREKTIAFENPEGEVTVSLSAIEDLIKKIGRQIPEIKDLRASVIATKKSVNIANRIVLFAGANIPETTEKIQSIIKTKVQEMLGIEEPIIIKVHISKIASSEKEEKAKIEEPPRVFKGIEYTSD